MTPHVRVLGTRGLPGRHGGFESFAEDLAPFLVEQGWDVTVYCQDDGGARGRRRRRGGPTLCEERWHGVRLVHVPVSVGGPLGTIVFDWKCTRHALRERGVALVLGYNTAGLNILHRLRGTPTVLNTDGFEWKRAKWSWPARAWFYVNEWLGCWASHHLVADHPVIADHLATRAPRAKTTMIPYGARAVDAADPAPLADLGLVPGGYAIVIARPEPENSIDKLVRAFGRRARGVTLVVLGRYDRAHPYQRRVLDAAAAARAATGADIVFPGPIYDRERVDALRFHAALYIHGHTVGGTNPSLVEGLGAGVAVLAHDNPFNRWVAGPGAEYFADEDGCAAQFDRLLGPGGGDALERMRRASRRRHDERFTLRQNLERYETVLRHVGAARGADVPAAAVSAPPTDARRSASLAHRATTDATALDILPPR